MLSTPLKCAGTQNSEQKRHSKPLFLFIFYSLFNFCFNSLYSITVRRKAAFGAEEAQQKPRIAACRSPQGKPRAEAGAHGAENSVPHVVHAYDTNTHTHTHAHTRTHTHTQRFSADGETA